MPILADGKSKGVKDGPDKLDQSQKKGGGEPSSPSSNSSTTRGEGVHVDSKRGTLLGGQAHIKEEGAGGGIIRKQILVNSYMGMHEDRGR